MEIRNPRAFRLWVMFEVVVEDPTSLAAADILGSLGEDGEPGMTSPGLHWGAVCRVIQMAAEQPLRRAGVRFVSGSALPQMLDMDTGEYPEMTLPAIPSNSGVTEAHR